jgi:hypothetical protein
MDLTQHADLAQVSANAAGISDLASTDPRLYKHFLPTYRSRLITEGVAETFYHNDLCNKHFLISAIAS